jgi:predicted methyltransferase
MRRIGAAALQLLVAGTCLAAAGVQRPVDPLTLPDGADREGWQQPDRVMDELGIADGARVADVMAGAGWFSMRLARRVGPNGLVYAEDSDPAMTGAITRAAAQDDVSNIRVVRGGPSDPHLPPGLQVAVIVDAFGRFSRPVDALKNIAASLAPNGRLGVIDFTKNGAGGPGPPVDERVDPATVVRDAALAGLQVRQTGRFLRYEFLLVFVKAP